MNNYKIKHKISKIFYVLLFFLSIDSVYGREDKLGALNGVLISGQIEGDRIDGRTVFILKSGRTYIADKVVIKKERETIIFFGGAIIVDSVKGEVRRAVEAEGYVIVEKFEKETYFGKWEVIELNPPIAK